MLAGHQKQWQLLKKSKELGRFSHAFLFCGESGIGKKKAAVEAAKLFFCSDSKSAPCGKCPNCLSVEKNNYPDFILLEPDKGIQVSQIRDLIWKLSLKPYCSDYKIAVIDQAHLMEKEAQNCLLKTLEEPKGNTLLILITEYPEALFDTIVSRVQKLKFFPLSKKDIKSYLLKSGIEEIKADNLSCICCGKIGRAIDYCKDEGKIKEREKIISDFEKISSSDIAERFKYAKDYYPKLKEILDVLLDYFRDALVLKIKKEDRSVLKIKKTISFIQYIKYLSSTTNINPRLALEILLLEV